MEPDSKKFWTSCVTWWPLIVQNLWKSDLSSWCTVTFDRFNFSFYFRVRNRFNKTFFILSVIGPSHFITLEGSDVPVDRNKSVKYLTMISPFFSSEKCSMPDSFTREWNMFFIFLDYSQPWKIFMFFSSTCNQEFLHFYFQKASSSLKAVSKSVWSISNLFKFGHCLLSSSSNSHCNLLMLESAFTFEPLLSTRLDSFLCRFLTSRKVWTPDLLNHISNI